MQSCRASSRLPITQAKRILHNPTPVRNMSFLPNSFFAHQPTSNSTTFQPLFRLLDEFESYNRSNGRHHHRTSMKTFNPRFDVREAGDKYELHGEFPGIDQKDIEIEFTDASTIAIRGRTERTYNSGPTTPAAVEGESKQALAAEAADTTSQTSHQATVEDEDAIAAPDAPATTSEVARQETAPKEPESRLWVSERSIGEFSRSFTFPVRVDQEAVRASMNNGILSIVVPKAKKLETRKITIA